MKSKPSFTSAQLSAWSRYFIKCLADLSSSIRRPLQGRTLLKQIALACKLVIIWLLWWVLVLIWIETPFLDGILLERLDLWPVLRTPRCSRCLFSFTVQPAEASQWICKEWQIALLMVFTCYCLVCWLMRLAEPPPDSAVLLLVQPCSCRGVGHWPKNSSRQETELCLL